MLESSKTISGYLESEIARGSFPGSQYAVGKEGSIIAEAALGFATVQPDRIPATLDTIYDCASLTKPLVTALLIVRFAERGLLDLRAPVASYLDEFKDSRIPEITLTQLLTHTSPLPSWRPLYLEAGTREAVPATIARILLEPRPQPFFNEVVYSDLSYILLGFVLERVTGEQLDRLAVAEIFKPLGLKRTMFNPPVELIRDTAATERGQEFEHANAKADAEVRRGGEVFSASIASSGSLPLAPQHRWRQEMIWGEVHDGNAKFMGGVAGHAGLFSTAREVFKIANQFLPGSEALKPDSLQLFSDNLTPACATFRSIAWILAATPDCSAGPALPPTAFGHNGFTGTSVWMDPAKRRVLVLLTNRVHPKVGFIDMRAIRRAFNTIAVETLQAAV